MRAYHDLGGQPAGSVQRSEHEYALWERRVHALLLLLADPQRNAVNVDELRRGIESLGAEEYDRITYYERWIAAITRVLLEKRILTQHDLGRKLAEVEAREVLS